MTLAVCKLIWNTNWLTSNHVGLVWFYTHRADTVQKYKHNGTCSFDQVNENVELLKIASCNILDYYVLTWKIKHDVWHRLIFYSRKYRHHLDEWKIHKSAFHVMGVVCFSLGYNTTHFKYIFLHRMQNCILAFRYFCTRIWICNNLHQTCITHYTL